MTKNLDELIPPADEVMRKMALAEAEKAAEAFRKHAQAEAQKKEEIERLAGPSGLSEEEKKSNSPPRSLDGRSTAAAPRCWSIVSQISYAPIMDVRSIKGNQVRKRP